MGKFVDLTGQQFGRLTVIKRVENNKFNQIQWLCRCECGNEKIVSGNLLKKGNIKSCGCIRNINYLGKKIGKLTVIEFLGRDEKRGNGLWKCLCECGNEKIITTSDLKTVKSCGCARNPIRNDLTGKKFGRWTVLELSQKGNGKVKYLCQCECGTIKEVNATDLVNGKNKSCGCYKIDIHSTHNLSKDRLYKVWTGIKGRCYNENNPHYKNYGGRGITMCEEWENNFQSFYDWAYANGYDKTVKKGMCTIDRIDVNKGYSPENCRWVDMKTQDNNKRNTIYLTYKGEKKSLTEWTELTGITKHAILKRLKLNWDIEKILTTPVNKKYSHPKNAKNEQLNHL